MTSSLDDGLEEHWKLDEASGTRASQINSLTLTDNNTVLSETGRLGANAALFAATNLETLTRATSSVTTCGDIDFTWAFWFKLTLAARSLVCTYIYKEATNTSLRDYWFYSENAGVVFAKENSSGTFKAVTWGKVTSFSWHLCVGWHDATNDLLWLQIDNGTPVSASMAASGVAAATPQNLIFGGSVSAGQYHDGALTSLTLWKRILTDDERTMLWNEGNGLEYPFNPTRLWGQVVPGYKKFPKLALLPRIST